MYRNGIKRLLAVILSLGGMICLSPLLLVLCIAIKLDSPGPVFFKQKRVGIHKQHFNILKFRTMRIDTPHDMPTHLLHDPDQYITRVGRFLRLDGYYVEHLSFGLDVKCFFGTIKAVLDHDGVVEGGTGTLHHKK